jgi:hypothetical protein
MTLLLTPICGWPLAVAEEPAAHSSDVLNLPHIPGSIVWPDCEDQWFVRLSKPTLGKPACVEYSKQSADRTKLYYIEHLDAMGWKVCADDANTKYFNKGDERLMFVSLWQSEQQGGEATEVDIGLLIFALIPRSEAPC